MGAIVDGVVAAFVEPAGATGELLLLAEDPQAATPVATARLRPAPTTALRNRCRRIRAPCPDHLVGVVHQP